MGGKQCLGSDWQIKFFPFFRGSTDGSRFVGWLGTAGQNDSAAVLNDILTMKLDDNSFSASFLVNGRNMPLFPLAGQVHFFHGLLEYGSQGYSYTFDALS